MIEIARVELKKIQRKLLTSDQKMKMCGNRRTCEECLMVFKFNGIYFSCNQVRGIEQRIKDYWNKEIEIEEECL